MIESSVTVPVRCRPVAGCMQTFCPACREVLRSFIERNLLDFEPGKRDVGGLMARCSQTSLAMDSFELSNFSIRHLALPAGTEWQVTPCAQHEHRVPSAEVAQREQSGT